MKRVELIDRVVDCYMVNLLDNPETVRDALYCYFNNSNTDSLLATLKGFEFEDNAINSLTVGDIHA